MQALSIKRFNLVPLAAVLILGVGVGVGIGVGIGSLDKSGTAASPGQAITRQSDVYADIIRDTGGPMVMTTTTTWPRAFVSSGQGEGFVDATNSAVVASSLQAHTGLGQGEGFIGPGAIVESQLLAADTHKAYWSFGQGEGLVDATYQRPEPRIIKAYPHPEQGEGLVDPNN